LITGLSRREPTNRSP